MLRPAFGVMRPKELVFNSCEFRKAWDSRAAGRPEGEAYVMLHCTVADRCFGDRIGLKVANRTADRRGPQASLVYLIMYSLNGAEFPQCF
jgi:hypothetical protein